MSKAKTIEQLAELAKEAGPAAVRKFDDFVALISKKIKSGADEVDLGDISSPTLKKGRPPLSNVPSPNEIDMGKMSRSKIEGKLDVPSNDVSLNDLDLGDAPNINPSIDNYKLPVANPVTQRGLQGNSISPSIADEIPSIGYNKPSAGPLATRVSSDIVPVGPQVLGTGTRYNKAAGDVLDAETINRMNPSLRKFVNPKLAAVTGAGAIAASIGSDGGQIPPTPPTSDIGSTPSYQPKSPLVMPDDIAAKAKIEALEQDERELPEIKSETPVDLSTPDPLLNPPTPEPINPEPVTPEPIQPGPEPMPEPMPEPIPEPAPVQPVIPEPSPEPAPIPVPEAQGPDFVKMLEDAQSSAENIRNKSELLRATEKIGAGLSRSKVDTTGSDLALKQSQQPVTDATAKIGAHKEQQSYNKIQDEVNDDKKMSDPNSDISKSTVAELSKYGIKVKTAKEAKQLSPQIFNLLLQDITQKANIASAEIKSKAALTKADLDRQAELVKSEARVKSDMELAKFNRGSVEGVSEKDRVLKEALAKSALEASGNKEAKKLEEKASKAEVAKTKDVRDYTFKLQQAAESKNLGKLQATYNTGMRSLSAFKDFIKNPTGYTDYAMLSGSLKALQGDESVIRESEVRLGKNAASLIDKGLNYLDELRTGKSLRPEQRLQMENAIKILTESSAKVYLDTARPILNQADKYGIPHDMILSGSLLNASKGKEGYSDIQEKKIAHFMKNNKVGREEAVSVLTEAKKL